MSKELKVAIEVVREAGKILQKYYTRGQTGKVTFKGEMDRLSEADRRSEQIIRNILTKHFPTHTIIGEELGEDRKSSVYVWYVDPMCGSFNFLHGLPEFGISIALTVDNVPFVGSIYLPAFNELYWAQKGKGAYFEKKKISVSSANTLQTAVFTSDFSHDIKKREKQLILINKIALHVEYIKIMGSLPYTLCQLAKGKIEGHFERYVPPVHRMASLLLVQEAGGRVTDFKGREATISTDHFVATNGLLHDEVIRILNS